MNAANVRNAAQAANLAGRQSVANQNIDIANQNADLKRQLQQQSYNNQLQWLSGKTNAMNGVANYYGALDAAQGKQQQGAQQSMMGGLNSLASAGKMVANNWGDIKDLFSGSSTPSGDGTTEPSTPGSLAGYDMTAGETAPGFSWGGQGGYNA